MYFLAAFFFFFPNCFVLFEPFISWIDVKHFPSMMLKQNSRKKIKLVFSHERN